jgi:hypothetical protein
MVTSAFVFCFGKQTTYLVLRFFMALIRFWKVVQLS